jgi:hypothetical protein
MMVSSKTWMLEEFLRVGEKHDTEEVKSIIEAHLREKPFVYKEGVLFQIKHSFPRPYLHIKAIEAGRECKDGNKNMRRGAEKIYSDSFRKLPEYGEYKDKNGDVVIRYKRRRKAR